jgi:hypothetical protein
VFHTSKVAFLESVSRSMVLRVATFVGLAVRVECEAVRIELAMYFLRDKNRIPSSVNTRRKERRASIEKKGSLWYSIWAEINSLHALIVRLKS